MLKYTLKNYFKVVCIISNFKVHLNVFSYLLAEEDHVGITNNKAVDLLPKEAVNVREIYDLLSEDVVHLFKNQIFRESWADSG